MAGISYEKYVNMFVYVYTYINEVLYLCLLVLLDTTHWATYTHLYTSGKQASVIYQRLSAFLFKYLSLLEKSGYVRALRV